MKNTKYCLQDNNHPQLPVIPKADEDIQYFACLGCLTATKFK